MKLIPRSLSYLIAIGLVISFRTSSSADNWSNWRGPNVTGTVEGDFPIEWSNDRNIRWKIPMLSPSGATPIVWGDLVFLTAAEDGNNVVQCVRLSSGEQVWRTKLGTEKPGKHKKGSGSNPSPVTNGKLVFVYFKSGDLAGIDFRGNIVWQRNLQEEFAEDTLWWDLGTSPILTDNHLVVACVQSGPSYLAAFDPATGELAWKVDRLLEAPEESNQTYSTPVVVNHQQQELIITMGADHVTAHQAGDGQEVWRVGGMNPGQDTYFRSIASPVISDDIIVVPYGRGSTLTGISLDGEVRWRREEISADVPTPASKDGNVFVCGDKGRLVCVSARTGDPIWEVETGKNRNAFSASPILVGNHLYLTREDATTFVFDVGDDHQLLSTNKLHGFTVATPVFVSGQILIRTAETLYCIAD